MSITDNILEIKLNKAQFDRFFRRVERVAGPGAMEKIAIRAVNRTATKTRTLAIRNMARLTKVKAASIRKRVRTRLASKARLWAELWFPRRQEALIRRNAEQTPAGVTYDAPGGGRALLPHAFIAKMPDSGHTGVFIREPAGGGSSFVKNLTLYAQGQGQVLLKRSVRRSEALLAGDAGRELVGRLPIWEPKISPEADALDAYGVLDLTGTFARDTLPVELHKQIQLALSGHSSYVRKR